jgi:hypothetical protein
MQAHAQTLRSDDVSGVTVPSRCLGSKHGGNQLLLEVVHRMLPKRGEPEVAGDGRVAPALHRLDDATVFLAQITPVFRHRIARLGNAVRSGASGVQITAMTTLP